MHIYSGSPFVVPSTVERVYSSCSILQKAMLFPDPDNPDSASFILIDFSRPKPPIITTDVIVPAYPEKGNMVNVQGENDDLWFAHVLSCDRRSQTSWLHFYIEENGRYIRESHGRTADETIHWNLIVKIASGHWQDVYRSIL